MNRPDRFLDDLHSRASLTDVAGRKVTWDHRKSNPGKGDMWAPCPFRREKTPSFHVDERKGFHFCFCFGCHAKGGIVGFARETENVGYLEAAKILARANWLHPARVMPNLGAERRPLHTSCG